MASDEKSIPPPKSSAKAVNRGGRPRKFPPGEAKERKAAAQKQNRGPKASRPAPGTFQFIPYEPPGTEPSLSRPVPTVKNEQKPFNRAPHAHLGTTRGKSLVSETDRSGRSAHASKHQMYGYASLAE
ncbi:hypothetical protein V500_03083 [Pseudogymnoascus sp. VKM F-4518 (FW-2643)]|nr:hypothetical protein V500_03083 [Pseudogymnoascus sp. VKM F-4518 (FW-2643)]